MKEIIRAMRVLAGEVAKQSIEINEELKATKNREIVAALYSSSNSILHLASALKGAADRLESELPREPEWIEWRGSDGSLPAGVSGNDIVEIDNVHVGVYRQTAHLLDWRHIKSRSDILRYRVVQVVP